MTTDSILIPDKSEYKLNEVCGLAQVKSYVLRFWESEFEQIKAVVTSSGQKVYSRRDLEIILQIKKLLFEDKLTIDRAKGEIQKLFEDNNFNDETIESEIIFENNFQIGNKEIQKIVLLKAKLNSIISQTESIKNRNNWK